MLFQLVKEPTRGDNILDLVLTGNPDIVHTVTVGEKLGRSDHRSVGVDLNIPVPRIPLADRKVILYSKGDYEAFSEEVKSTDWIALLDSRKIEDKWVNLKNKYNQLVDKYVPVKMVKSGQRHRPPWTNYRSVKQAKKKKRAAAVKARKSNLNVHHEQFLKSKSRVDEVIRRAKLDYKAE